MTSTGVYTKRRPRSTRAAGVDDGQLGVALLCIGAGGLDALGRHPKDVGHARTYKVTKADAGHPLVCSVTASNDGGISTAPFAPSSMVKIPR